ncbi:hypothetical protein JEQ12_003784 [Ovis aries]|uniref:Uncharacterized protein n=1 Tax=Ovis aries TaxID=9940 RepID=A0A836CYI8_SHEEP|nr:hypothetical protein JEQ12_003784 [Ovis aries]
MPTCGGLVSGEEVRMARPRRTRCDPGKVTGQKDTGPDFWPNEFRRHVPKPSFCSSEQMPPGRAPTPTPGF